MVIAHHYNMSPCIGLNHSLAGQFVGENQFSRSEICSADAERIASVPREQTLCDAVSVVRQTVPEPHLHRVAVRDPIYSGDHPATGEVCSLVDLAQGIQSL